MDALLDEALTLPSRSSSSAQIHNEVIGNMNIMNRAPTMSDSTRGSFQLDLKIFHLLVQ